MARPQRPVPLALHRRLMDKREMQLWPYCAADHCVRPAMESLQLCLAGTGERLLCRLFVCSAHADSVPLPIFQRPVPPEAPPDEGEED